MKQEDTASDTNPRGKTFPHPSFVVVASNNQYLRINGKRRKYFNHLFRFWSIKLQLVKHDKRKIDGSMVIFDGDDQDPDTDTWYDCMTPELLLAGDGGPHIIAQMNTIVPDAFYSGSPGGRKDEEFEAVLEQIKASVGRDISGLALQGQAAAVAQGSQRGARGPIVNGTAARSGGGERK